MRCTKYSTKKRYAFECNHVFKHVMRDDVCILKNKSTANKHSSSIVYDTICWHFTSLLHLCQKTDMSERTKFPNLVTVRIKERSILFFLFFFRESTIGLIDVASGNTAAYAIRLIYSSVSRWLGFSSAANQSAWMRFTGRNHGQIVLVTSQTGQLPRRAPVNSVGSIDRTGLTYCRTRTTTRCNSTKEVMKSRTIVRSSDFPLRGDSMSRRERERKRERERERESKKTCIAEASFHGGC